MSAIEAEDVVMLISGGPEMTVKEVYDNNYVSCVWINQRNDTMHGSFPLHLITKVEE